MFKFLAAVVAPAVLLAGLSVPAQAKEIDPQDYLQSMLNVSGAFDRNGDRELDGRDWERLGKTEREKFVLYATTVSLLGAAAMDGGTIDDSIIKRLAGRQAPQLQPMIAGYYAKHRRSKVTVFEVMNMYMGKVK